MVFFGEYRVSFTGAGRVVLPKKIRELLKGSTFVLSKGFDSCLAGYDLQDWEQRIASVLSGSPLDRENIEKKRFFFGSTVYLEIDEQGRFVIPKNLLQHAGITDQVIIIGVGDHFEIWDTKKWELYAKKMSN